MREIRLPIPQLKGDETTEITVSMEKEKRTFNFRIEAFKWGENATPHNERIDNLRQSIVDYDNNYEIIQIFTPSENSKYIQVLFREKEQSNM